jgi:tRNA (guanine37-N1)-methyltransferase
MILILICGMKFTVLTLFPDMFECFKRDSIIGRAVEDELIDIKLVNIRDFGLGKHSQVDDTPYGGGAGMLMRCDVLFSVFDDVQKRLLIEAGVPHNFPMLRQRLRRTSQFSIFNFQKECKKQGKKVCRVFLTPQGERLTQKKVEELSEYDELVLLCGRYEGVDQRVRDELIDEEISVGDFVLTGGELPAMMVMDSVSRLVPGVLGKEESHQEDSFSAAFDGKKEYPHYTKPAEYEGLKVPEVLLSGDHAEIEKWRRAHLR